MSENIFKDISLRRREILNNVNPENVAFLILKEVQ